MQYSIGDKAAFSKTISESDIYQFAGITGDFNPMHINEEYAKGTRFGKRIAHGMLTSSFICTVLGMKLPGPGTIHISQQLEFLKPVYIGDTITVNMEITEVLEKGFLKIRSSISNQNNEMVVDGFSVVKPPKATT
jgi:3-hydroxybutyryl-CoA dehydratase